jgi:GNAT superfamily N-acetyltransferase
VRIVELDSAGPAVKEMYDEILAPSFPVDELAPLVEIQQLPAAEQGSVFVARSDTDDTILGCAIAEWDADPGVCLLCWLAVRPDRRGTGIGGPLLDAAMTEWKKRFSPCLILAEVEDPEQHSGSTAHGDPAARLRFYQRRGARSLELPYFQAALGPDKSRVRGLLLMVLHADEQFAGTEPNTVDGSILKKYLELYQTQCEGAVATDQEAMALWRATDRPGGVRLLPT